MEEELGITHRKYVTKHDELVHVTKSSYALVRWYYVYRSQDSKNIVAVVVRGGAGGRCENCG